MRREVIMSIEQAALGDAPSTELVLRVARDQEQVRRGFWSKARRVAAKLPFAEDLLATYYCAFDPATPFHVRAALMGALAYFVLPFDVVPDILPALGYTDDAAVLVAAL